MELQNYETVFVVTADTQGDKLKAIEDKLQKLFKTHKVENIEKRDWGVLHLAYKIKNSKTGHYFQYNYDAPAAFVADLERNLGYEENVLRYLTFKSDNDCVKDNPVESVGFDWQ